MMSLGQVRKTFHRHLLLDTYLPSSFHSDFCLNLPQHPSSSYSSSPSSSTSPFNSATDTVCNYYNSSKHSYSDDSGGEKDENGFITGSTGIRSQQKAGFIGTPMDTMDYTRHHCKILKATLEVNKRQSKLKGKSPVVDSLKYKTTAAALSTPSSSTTSLVSPSAATTTMTTASPSRPLFPKSKIPIAAHPSSSCNASFLSKSKVPYYASCFSPLDLPSEIFLYLLQFLQPADLWRLCQVSRTMQAKTLGYMSKLQKFNYAAVRILHQEHSDALSEPSMRRGETFYDRMTATTCSTRIAQLSRVASQNQGQVHSRSSYWLAQARFLVASIMERTAYEPRQEVVRRRGGKESTRATLESGNNGGSSSNHGGSDHSDGTGSSIVRFDNHTDVTPASTTTAPLMHDDAAEEEEEVQSPEEGANQDETEIATMTNTETHEITSAGSFWSSTAGPAQPPSPSAVAPTLSFLAGQGRTSGLNAKGKFRGPPPGSLPQDRLLAMVDLLFDPNMVHLNHRRAIINCARYVSASIDETFMTAFSTKDPFNPDFHATFQDRCVVHTGPYLTMYSPILYDDDGLELTEQEQALIGRASTKVIYPPQKLQNFQILLWHRCLSDLIALYNKIQDRHLPEAHPIAPSSSKRKHKKEISTAASSLTSLSSPVCCQDPPRSASRFYSQSRSSDETMSQACQESYPMCCHAHSLVFSAEYASSHLVPYPVRVHFRRMVQKVQAATHRAFWSATSGIRSSSSFSGPSGLWTRRMVEYTGPRDRLRFCSGSVHPPNYARVSSSLDLSNKDGKKQQVETEALMQQRLRIEEGLRQDTLMKQELLALCHMACGLFLVEERAAMDTPPTIMSLLRQGGPWNKGVWREGEWRRLAIDPSSSPKSGKTASRAAPNNSSSNSVMDQGRWQKICVATIQFLAHEDLSWGGNRANAELSRLRTTSNASSWIYHE
ncbi:hypothetical protein EMPS_08197 [Entomortierella parvispora]|uniref:F-box domain-containing protein n=1 Tax=Entomortierella parvispora TaxID=205924 RepID=A0A9P3HFP7_9FUNG|nr:hypothetical protein EMPS_08197 [Entomortierella parvispora]